jgi:hypothetical protein
MQWFIPKLLAIGVTTLALPAAAPMVWPRFVSDDSCEDVAAAQKKAAEFQAQADLWTAAANARNAPDSEGKAREKAARAAYDDALALAKSQYKTRLEVCDQIGGGKYDPQLSPQDFSTTLDNPLSPHVPGQTMVYEGDSAEGFVHNEVTTTDTLVTINGFLVREVTDVVTLDGVLSEDATDFFAQRSNGDQWYFGEVSRSYADGFLDSLEGSWRAGKDEAKPGIVMLADNHVGDAYRQEYQVDVAEDVAMVLATDETVTVKYGTFSHCVKTFEISGLEPDASEWKFYAPGIGLVLVEDLQTGDRLELVAVK